MRLRASFQIARSWESTASTWSWDWERCSACRSDSRPPQLDDPAFALADAFFVGSSVLPEMAFGFAAF